MWLLCDNHVSYEHVLTVVNQSSWNYLPLGARTEWIVADLRLEERRTGLTTLAYTCAKSDLKKNFWERLYIRWAFKWFICNNETVKLFLLREVHVVYYCVVLLCFIILLADRSLKAVYVYACASYCTVASSPCLSVKLHSLFFSLLVALWCRL